MKDALTPPLRRCGGVAAMIVLVALSANCRDDAAPNEPGDDIATPGESRVRLEETPGLVKLSEPALRWSAVDVMVPSYPAASIIRRSSGVAVATVQVGAEGRVRRVDVEQAPDSDIAHAMRAAIGKWTFTPISVAGSDVKRPLLGKLTFYFVLQNGRGSVFNPTEMAVARRDAAPEEVPQ